VLIAPPGSRSQAEAERRGLEARAVAMRGALDLPAVLQLWRTLAAARVDLVHLHTGRATWLGGWAARLAHLQAVSTRRQDRPLKRSLRTRLLYGRLLARTVAISPAVAARLEAGGVRSPLVIASSVDLRGLRPERARASLRAELGAGPEACVVLTLAALVQRKGVDVLLRALAELRTTAVPVQLWVAGDGPERASLERLGAALDLAGAVRFLGSRADKADLLAACDVFALASRSEGLGVAALEAMALERPVVASRVGGLAEAVVDGRTGLLVPPDDPHALGAALARLAGDAGLRRKLGAAGPARVREGFEAEQMVSAYERLYHEVLSA
jgi:glycosyltransferase involved in cell wall biosynthesis